MNRQKLIIIILVVAALIMVVGALRFFSGDEDTWLCQNGQWVKHGNPSAPMPSFGCGTLVASPTPRPEGEARPDGAATTHPDIEVFYPQPGATARSPLILEGRARGSWFFEASAPIKLLDGQGKGIATSIIQAIGDWMTTDFVPFAGELKFSASSTINGVLVFNNDNPSGLPENSKEFRVPVIISPEQATVVKVFFNNDRLDPEFSCNKVYAVSREIPKTQALARAALEELLKGPTENEKLLGFLTSINSGVKIQKLTIADGVAKIDFDEQLEFQVGGSCRVSAIRAQITQTLKQFSAVQSVVISINGRTEDILQP